MRPGRGSLGPPRHEGAAGPREWLEKGGVILGVVFGFGFVRGLAGVAGEDLEGFAVGGGLGGQGGELGVALELAQGLADIREGADDVEGVTEALDTLGLPLALRGDAEGFDLGASGLDGGDEEGGELG